MANVQKLKYAIFYYSTFIKIVQVFKLGGRAASFENGSILPKTLKHRDDANFSKIGKGKCHEVTKR